MAIEADRRILHITTDNLENLNDTQIAFEDFRDETGLSYFGGAFGGRFDSNANIWGNSITRFARYNSSPVFKSLIFNQNNDMSGSGSIILTNNAELDTNSSGNPTPDDVSPRSKRSINIGILAGVNVSSIGESIYIGDSAGLDSYTTQSTCIGLQAGKNSSIDYGVMIGVGAGINSNGNRSILIGGDTKTSNDQCIAIGLNASTSGRNSISIGTTAGLSSQTSHESIYIGMACGERSTNNYRTIGMGVDNLLDSHDIYQGTYLGAWSGSHSGDNVYSIGIGVDSGVYTYNDVGSISIGWESGYQQVSIDNPYMAPLTLNGYSGPHKGFNINLGAMAGNSTSSSDAINIGYCAGQGVGGTLSTINIGTYSGQNTSGNDCIYIGTQAGGYVHSGDNSIYIGKYSGRTGGTDALTTYPNLYTGENGSFELSMNSTPIDASGPGGNATTYANILFSGNFGDASTTGDNGWVWANNLFGMCPQAQTTIDGYIDIRKGFMVYNNDENVPQYYDGSNWQNMAGGGSSSFTGLDDTPTNYTGKSYSLSVVNDTQSGLIFTDTVAIKESDRTLFVKNGTFRLNRDNTTLFDAAGLEMYIGDDDSINNCVIYATQSNSGGSGINLLLEADGSQFSDLWNDTGSWSWRYRDGTTNTDVMKIEHDSSGSTKIAKLMLPLTTNSVIDNEPSDSKIAITKDYLETNYNIQSQGTRTLNVSDGNNGWIDTVFNYSNDHRLSMGTGNNEIEFYYGGGGLPSISFSSDNQPDAKMQYGWVSISDGTARLSVDTLIATTSSIPITDDRDYITKGYADSNYEFSGSNKISVVRTSSEFISAMESDDIHTIIVESDNGTQNVLYVDTSTFTNTVYKRVYGDSVGFSNNITFTNCSIDWYNNRVQFSKNITYIGSNHNYIRFSCNYLSEISLDSTSSMYYEKSVYNFRQAITTSVGNSLISGDVGMKFWNQNNGIPNILSFYTNGNYTTQNNENIPSTPQGFLQYDGVTEWFISQVFENGWCKLRVGGMFDAKTYGSNYWRIFVAYIYNGSLYSTKSSIHHPDSNAFEFELPNNKLHLDMINTLKIYIVAYSDSNGTTPVSNTYTDPHVNVYVDIIDLD